MDFSPEAQPSPAQPNPMRGFEEKTTTLLSFTNMLERMKVQGLLARLAFPEHEKPLHAWTEDKTPGDSLASRFSAYVEDLDRTDGEKEIDTTNAARMEALLEAVRRHPPETMH